MVGWSFFIMKISNNKVKYCLLLLMILVFFPGCSSTKISETKSTQAEDSPTIAWVLSEKNSHQFVDLSGGKGKANFPLFLNKQDADVVLKQIQSVNPELANSKLVVAPVELIDAIETIKRENKTCTIFKNASEGITCEETF
jgi:hypothetical protein